MQLEVMPAKRALTREGQGATSLIIAVPDHSDVRLEVKTGTGDRPAVLKRTTHGVICTLEALVGGHCRGTWRCVEESVVLVLEGSHNFSRLSASLIYILAQGWHQKSTQFDQLSALYTVSRGGGWRGVAFDESTRLAEEEHEDAQGRSAIARRASSRNIYASPNLSITDKEQRRQALKSRRPSFTEGIGGPLAAGETEAAGSIGHIGMKVVPSGSHLVAGILGEISHDDEVDQLHIPLLPAHELRDRVDSFELLPDSNMGEMHVMLNHYSWNEKTAGHELFKQMGKPKNKSSYPPSAADVFALPPAEVVDSKKHGASTTSGQNHMSVFASPVMKPLMTGDVNFVFGGN
jgi:hypothetical protein